MSSALRTGASHVSTSEIDTLLPGPSSYGSTSSGTLITAAYLGGAETPALKRDEGDRMRLHYYIWSVYLIVPPEHHGEEFDNVPTAKRQLGTLLRRSLSIGRFLILTRPLQRCFSHFQSRHRDWVTFFLYADALIYVVLLSHPTTASMQLQAIFYAPPAVSALVWSCGLSERLLPHAGPTFTLN